MRGFVASVSPKCGPCLDTQDVMAPTGTQDPSHPGFVGPAERYDCGQCIRWHGERFQFPALLPANVQAWELYWLLQDQVRAGLDVIGLDYAVLPWIFALYAVPAAEQRLLFEKIAVMNRTVMADRATKREHEKATHAAAAERARGRTRLDV